MPIQVDNLGCFEVLLAAPYIVDFRVDCLEVIAPGVLGYKII